MRLRFRRATEADLDRVLDVHLAAYPDDLGIEARRRLFTSNPFGGLRHLMLAEHAAEIAGFAFLYPHRAWFGGREVGVGGIASVAVAPEARGRGVATALLAELHRISNRRRDAVQMLHAFRRGFYERLGYASAAPRLRLYVAPEAIPPEYRVLARDDVHRLRASDRRGLEGAYARAAAHASGWFARNRRRWDRLHARERRQTLLLRRGHRVTGYVAFELVQSELHGRTVAVVDELIADDDETRRALWGALSGLRDQVAEIEIEVDLADPIDRVLVDPDRRRFGTREVEHSIGTLVGGPMVRIEDPVRALEARGYAAKGSFDVQLRDGDFHVGVRIAHGVAAVGRPLRRYVLRTTRKGLAAMLYGALRPSDAARLGLADADADALARVDAILAMPPLLPVDPF